jgi:hypothetical protein
MVGVAFAVGFARVSRTTLVSLFPCILRGWPKPIRDAKVGGSNPLAPTSFLLGSPDGPRARRRQPADASSPMELLSRGTSIDVSRRRVVRMRRATAGDDAQGLFDAEVSGLDRRSLCLVSRTSCWLPAGAYALAVTSCHDRLDVPRECQWPGLCVSSTRALSRSLSRSVSSSFSTRSSAPDCAVRVARMNPASASSSLRTSL